MEVDRKTYVLAIDVLRDYKDIILIGRHPIDPNIDLDDVHLVIPDIVIRDLSKLAVTEHYARELLNELRSVAEKKTEIVAMGAVYRLHAAAKVKNSNQLLSILPVQKDLLQNLPFRLSEDDIDDQTIATAIEASLALAGRNVRLDTDMVYDATFDKFENVKLLTNDAGLAIRAHWYGIQTSRYDSWRRK